MSLVRDIPVHGKQKNSLKIHTSKNPEAKKRKNSSHFSEALASILVPPSVPFPTPTDSEKVAKTEGRSNAVQEKQSVSLLAKKDVPLKHIASQLITDTAKSVDSSSRTRLPNEQKAESSVSVEQGSLKSSEQISSRSASLDRSTASLNKKTSTVKIEVSVASKSINANVLSRKDQGETEASVMHFASSSMRQNQESSIALSTVDQRVVSKSGPTQNLSTKAERGHLVKSIKNNTIKPQVSNIQSNFVSLVLHKQYTTSLSSLRKKLVAQTSSPVRRSASSLRVSVQNAKPKSEKASTSSSVKSHVPSVSSLSMAGAMQANSSVANIDLKNASTPVEKPVLPIQSPQSTQILGKIIASQVNQNGSSLTVQIQPENLGNVVITVQHLANNGSISVQISAENPQAAQWFQNSQRELMDSLQSQGFALNGFNVSYQHGSSQERQGNQTPFSSSRRPASSLPKVTRTESLYEASLEPENNITRRWFG